MAGILKDWASSTADWRIIANELSMETTKRRPEDQPSQQLQEACARHLSINDLDRVRRALKSLDAIGNPPLTQEQCLDLLASMNGDDSPIPNEVRGKALEEGLAI